MGGVESIFVTISVLCEVLRNVENGNESWLCLISIISSVLLLFYPDSFRMADLGIFSRETSNT